MRKFMLLIAISFSMLSCRHDKNSESEAMTVEPNNAKSADAIEFIPVNRNDENYGDALPYLNDTITNDGWSIQYLVKNDSTKYLDVYIKVSKARNSAIYKAESALEMRRYFIPTYLSENETHIFFKHGCATDCSAILSFSKKENEFTDYLHVVDYDLKNGQILFVDQNSYANEQSVFDLVLEDLIRNRSHKLTYSGVCLPTYKPSCIDTVIFSKNRTTIITKLTDNKTRDKEVLETQIVNLN